MFWFYIYSSFSFIKFFETFKDPVIEWRNVTSRYHGSKISGVQATTTATATRTSKKKRNRFIVAKQQLCMCLTLIRSFLSRRCRTWDMKLTNSTRPLYGAGEHNPTRKFPFLFKNGLLTDPQLRWILWIISKTGYFRYMIRGVSLLRIRKEWIEPAVTWNIFNTYSTAHLLNSRHGVKDRFYAFYRNGKIAIQTGPALF